MRASEGAYGMFFGDVSSPGTQSPVSSIAYPALDYRSQKLGANNHRISTIEKPSLSGRHFIVKSYTAPSTSASVMEISSDTNEHEALSKPMVFGLLTRSERNLTTSKLKELSLVTPSESWATAAMVCGPAESSL